MTQEQIAQRIREFAHRLADIATSSARNHNLEKQILVKDIKTLAVMLKWDATDSKGESK